MSDFAGDLKRFTQHVEARSQAVFVNVCAAAKDSIVSGSAITGAPGQPVDTGYLKASWQLRFESKTVAEISTNVSYAPVIEDNTRASYDPSGVDRPAGLKPIEPGGSQHIASTVGGNHSVKLTIAGFQRLVAAENAKP